MSTLDQMDFSNLPAGSSDSIKPFEINIQPKVLNDLKDSIKLSAFAPLTYESSTADPKDLESFGISYEWLQKARDAWLTYDWKKSESYINTFPHFKASIRHNVADFDVHFVGLFSERKNAIPIVYLHGWPGSFLEFLPTLSLLKKKYTPSTLPFHVVVPSLPGYTFSSCPPTDRNFTRIDVASIIDKLMHQLGLGNCYIAQGGDLSSAISRLLGKNHEGCKAVHVNAFPIQVQPEGAPEIASVPLNEQRGFARAKHFVSQGWAYGIEHGTRPATIGFVLQSSPIALLSWIGEKFIAWTDETPQVDTILESVTLYWITHTISRCLYPYREKYDPKDLSSPKPLGLSQFHKEIGLVPESWARTRANVVFYRWHDEGGHFAALEKPELLLKDVEDFVSGLKDSGVLV